MINLNLPFAEADRYTELGEMKKLIILANNQRTK
jgi:hypothetical protein